MSRSPYFFIEKYNKYTKKYELQHPIVWNYDHTKQELADLFPYNGCHDLFSIVTNSCIGNDFPIMRGIHNGLPEDVTAEVQKVYDSCCYETDYMEEKCLCTPDARWFTYADMYIYCLENPVVTDYDAMNEACYYAQEGEKIETITTSTPVKALMNRVDAFLEVTDGFDWRDDYSLIRIVYWIL